MGYVGGLYPGGVNNPSGIYARDLQSACKLIIPIDTFGRTSATAELLLFLWAAAQAVICLILCKLKQQVIQTQTRACNLLNAAMVSAALL